MKLQDLGDYEIVNEPSRLTGFSIDRRNVPLSSFDDSQSALAHSQSMLDNVFRSPLQAISAGDAGANIERLKGAGKQALSEFSSAGIHNAGPAGKAMMDQGLAKGNTFAQGLQGLDKSLQPSNIEQSKGMAETGIAEALLPVGALRQSGLVKTLSEKSGLSKILSGRSERKALEATIDAVYNSPTGAKFKKTSGQALAGERELTPASMFREQGLTPDQQTVSLATRLKELGLGKDPVKNSRLLADDFAETETKLQKALTADPEIKYLADKPTLTENLNLIKFEAPQEFRIKDSQSMVNRVVDFGNKVIAQAEDSIGGIREARKAFDAQAKREFPTAFKSDGTIDTKTPAGFAIKETRDRINAHLYDTAPNGSEIQALIGREADLYRAAQVSFEKAMSGQGKTTIQQWAKDNPGKAALLGFGATGVAGGVGGAAVGASFR